MYFAVDLIVVSVACEIWILFWYMLRVIQLRRVLPSGATVDNRWPCSRLLPPPVVNSWCTADKITGIAVLLQSSACACCLYQQSLSSQWWGLAAALCTWRRYHRFTVNLPQRVYTMSGLFIIMLLVPHYAGGGVAICWLALFRTERLLLPSVLAVWPIISWLAIGRTKPYVLAMCDSSAAINNRL